MIEDILTQSLPVPARLTESILRRSGIAHLASAHPSPVGSVVVVRARTHVTAVVPETHADEMLSSYEGRTGVPAFPDDQPPAAWAERLDKALASGRGRTIKTSLLGVSEFQRRVLETTSRIPVGETRPYAWVAKEMSMPGAVRAVGTALRRNPIPLLIPCHRVVKSDGTLGQYAFGTPMKLTLLETEDFAPRVTGHLVGARAGHVACYPSCHHARRIKEPVVFRSLVAAREAGYRACDHCRPV